MNLYSFSLVQRKEEKKKHMRHEQRDLWKIQRFTGFRLFKISVEEMSRNIYSGRKSLSAIPGSDYLEVPGTEAEAFSFVEEETT